MQTGSLNTDSFSQVLRGLSQRRKQGILEIRYPDNLTKIYFNQGRIVDFTEAKVSPFLEVTQILDQAGLLKKSSLEEVATYKDLYHQLSLQTKALNQEVFKRVLKHRVLNKLYSLDLKSGAFFTFNAQMIEGDREFLPSVSAGGLLLDLVALESDSSRFEETFPADKKIVRSVTEPPGLSEEEQIVFDLIGEGIDRSSLVTRSMLSKFALQDALLAMHDRGYVSIDAPTTSQSAAVTDLDALVSALEGPLDAAIDTAFSAPAPAEQGAQTVSPAKPVKPQPQKVSAAPRQESLTIYSTRLLYAPSVLNALLFIWICVGLLAPFLVWPDALFARF